MAAPNLSNLSRVRISTTSSGTYTSLGYVRSASLDRGSEGDTTLRWLGGDAVVPGDLTLAGNIPIWWDDADTLGQEVAEAAYLAQTAVWLQFCPTGTASGKKVKQFEAYITSAPFSFDSEGEAVEGSLGFRGTPSTYTTVTLGA
jgi:hypothetical protein